MLQHRRCRIAVGRVFLLKSLPVMKLFLRGNYYGFGKKNRFNEYWAGTGR